MGIDTIVQNVSGQLSNAKKWLDEPPNANAYVILPQGSISGFVFTVKDEDRIELKSDVTDYVVEDNKTVQDHIAIKPIVITLRGFIGEVSNIVDAGAIGALNAVQEKLTEVSSYLPPYAQGVLEGAQQAVTIVSDTLKTIDNAIDRTQNLIGILGMSSPGNTKQERAFDQLWRTFATRQLVTVKTPWGGFDRMAIMAITCTQDNKTNLISDIMVQLKQLRFATVKMVKSTSGRTTEKKAPPVNKGKVKGEPVTDKSPLIKNLPNSGWKGALDYVVPPGVQ